MVPHISAAPLRHQVSQGRLGHTFGKLTFRVIFVSRLQGYWCGALTAAVWQCLWQSGCKTQRQIPAAQARQARPTAGQAEAHAQPGPASFSKMATLRCYTAATPLRHQSVPRRWAQAHGPGARPTVQANTLGSLCSDCCLRDAIAETLPRHPCDR